MHIKVVVAVNAGDLFNDVRLDGDVLGRAPARHTHGEVVAVIFRFKAQRTQGMKDRFVRDLNAGVPIHIRLVEVQHHFRIAAGVFIRQGRDDARVLIGICKQLHEPRDGGNGHFGVKAFFIAHGRICAVRQTYRRFAHGDRVERGGFQRKRRGVLHDLAVKPAHDARDRHRRVAVADHQRVFIDRALHAVERLERERLKKALDAQLFDLARVERMHRLPHFEHQVVR